MININKIQLTGNLTGKPQTNQAGEKDSVTKTRLAYNGLPFKTRNGEEKKETLFIDLEIWNGNGERLAELADKGTALLVEGEMRQSFWKNQDEENRYRYYLRVNRWQFATSKKNKDDAGKNFAPKSKTPKSKNK